MTIKTLAISFVLLLAVASRASAQASLLDSTTLNGAINATQTTLILTSATASTGSSFGAPAAGQCLWMDQEQMRFVSMSSATATVERRVSGRPESHATSAVILIGPCSNSGFKTSPPPQLSGNQTCSTQPLPWVDMNAAVVYWCDLVLNKWVATNAIAAYTFGSTRVAQ